MKIFGWAVKQKINEAIVERWFPNGSGLCPEIPTKEHTNMATMISLTGAQLNNPRVMEAFQEAMNEWQDEMILEMQNLAKELNISLECAAHVQYLRTRSRWTEEKEKELIMLYATGNPPKLGEF